MILQRRLSPATRGLQVQFTPQPLSLPPKRLWSRLQATRETGFLSFFLLLKLSWQGPIWKSFRITFIFHFSFTSSHTGMSTLRALGVTRRRVPENREGEQPREIQREEWRKGSKGIPHVFFKQPNLTKTCSLVVLLTNKQAIYCTVKCFILTPYSFYLCGCCRYIH